MRSIVWGLFPRMSRFALVVALVLAAGPGLAEHSRPVCEEESYQNHWRVNGCTDSRTWGGAAIDLVVHGCDDWNNYAYCRPGGQRSGSVPGEPIDIEMTACASEPGVVILNWQRTALYGVPMQSSEQDLPRILDLEATGNVDCLFRAHVLDRSYYGLIDYPHASRPLDECVHATAVLHTENSGGIAHGRGCHADGG